MKILCYSTLYPNAAQPSHGIFVENRLRRLVETGEVEAKVLAPVPWFPFAHERFGAYAAFAKAPTFEVRHGIDVYHPRYPIIPKIGMNITPHFLARASVRAAREIVKSGFDFDVLDGHYFYPDGLGAAAIAKALAKPFMVTARGTDINLIPQNSTARQRIASVSKNANALGAVCQALADEMVSLGQPSDKVHVLRNGVDLDAFTPMDRGAARQKWGVDGPVIVSVGGLVERKGHHLTIEAMQSLPDFTFLLAGGGPEESALRAQVAQLGLTQRVRLLGPVPHADLASLFSAADISVLASSREGWANVLLESMACGTPVVATNVWGTPEVVARPEAGELMDDRSAEAIVQSVKALWARLPARAATRAYAEGFDWAPTTRKQLALFQQLKKEGPLGAS
jgi:glycosyltransferase involved in cell wall biosynthesis